MPAARVADEGDGRRCDARGPGVGAGGDAAAGRGGIAPDIGRLSPPLSAASASF